MSIRAERKLKVKRAGSTLMEYAMLFTVIAMALTAMNVYMKRGINARLMDMSNYFISNEQVVETDPDSQTNSISNTISSGDSRSQMFIGGGTKVDSLSTSDTAGNSVSYTIEASYLAPFVSTEDGMISIPQYNEAVADNTEYVDNATTGGNDNNDHLASKNSIYRWMYARDKQMEKYWKNKDTHPNRAAENLKNAKSYQGKINKECNSCGCCDNIPDAILDVDQEIANGPEGEPNE